jgi:hypothetical protein
VRGPRDRTECDPLAGLGGGLTEPVDDLDRSCDPTRLPIC